MLCLSNKSNYDLTSCLDAGILRSPSLRKQPRETSCYQGLAVLCGTEGEQYNGKAKQGDLLVADAPLGKGYQHPQR